MELTNADIYNAKEPFGELMREKLPVKVAYGLAKIANALGPHLMVIEQVRDKLITDYGTVRDPRNPNAKSVEPGDANFPRFATEFGELMGATVEVDIEVVELPLKVSIVCGSCHQSTDRDLEIAPYILGVLAKFVKVGGVPVLTLS